MKKLALLIFLLVSTVCLSQAHTTRSGDTLCYDSVFVFTGPQFLFEMFNGAFNQAGTAQIKPNFDAYGRPIVGTQILKDPDWDYLDSVLIPMPTNTAVKKYISQWLDSIPYCKIDTLQF